METAAAIRPAVRAVNPALVVRSARVRRVVAGTRATDPVLVLGIPVLIAMVVGTAMFAPIRRLVRASPMTKLRDA